MKIWVVLKILGVIGETWGPLAGDMNICRTVVLQEEQNLDEKWARLQADPAMVFQGQVLKRSDITFECVEAEERPQ